MIQTNYIPVDYNGIKVVGDLCALLAEDFGSNANVILCPRRLNGDFDALAQKMAEHFDLQEEEIFIKFTDIQKLEDFRETLKADELLAALDVVLTDMEFFHHSGARPHIRVLKNYTEDKTTHDFHVDGIKQNFDRYMTCYNTPVTQFVRNCDVVGVDGHKAFTRDGAPVYEFRVGDVWKQRVRNKTVSGLGKFVKNVMQVDRRRAFVHRAQKSTKPRLMLVGDKRLP